MKLKKLLIIFSAVVSFSVIAYGFGAWAERLNIGILIRTADAFPSPSTTENKDEMPEEQTGAQVETSVPQDEPVVQEGEPIAPITEQPELSAILPEAVLSEEPPEPSRELPVSPEEPNEPTGEQIECTGEPAEPTEEPAVSAEESVVPAEELTEPTEEPTEPAEEPTEPAEETPAPTQPAEPIEEPAEMRGEP